MRVLRVGVLGLAVFAGCGSSTAVSDGATSIGRAEPIAVTSPTPVDTQPAIDERTTAATYVDGAVEVQLYTHCGINGIMIEGRWWQADPALNDGQGNPPKGWGNPYQPGTLRLVDPQTAVFSADPSSAGGTQLPSVLFHRTASTEYPVICS